MRAKISVVAAVAGSLLGMSSVPASADEIGPPPAFGEHVSDNCTAASAGVGNAFRGVCQQHGSWRRLPASLAGH